MAKSTKTGHVNPQQQRVIRRVGPSTSLPHQNIYELECLRPKEGGDPCGNRYGANGPDIDGAGTGTGRKCPVCQHGAEGEKL